VPLPPGKRRDEPDAKHISCGGKTRNRIQIDPWTVRREAVQIDRVPHRVNRHRTAAHLAHIVGDALRIGDDRSAATRIAAQQSSRERPAPRVIMQMPQDR